MKEEENDPFAASGAALCLHIGEISAVLTACKPGAAPVAVLYAAHAC
jgi:hypothetical protein